MSSNPESDATVYVENDQLIINSTIPVAAFDIIVSTNETIDPVSLSSFTCEVRQKGDKIHLVGFSLNGITLPIGKNAICSMRNGTVAYAMLADKEAKEINSIICDNTTNVQSSLYIVPTAKEDYRISMGARRAIVVDSTGKKTMIKDK